jgi:hypothetical protein
MASHDINEGNSFHQDYNMNMNELDCHPEEAFGVSHAGGSTGIMDDDNNIIMGAATTQHNNDGGGNIHPPPHHNDSNQQMVDSSSPTSAMEEFEASDHHPNGGAGNTTTTTMHDEEEEEELDANMRDTAMLLEQKLDSTKGWAKKLLRSISVYNKVCEEVASEYAEIQRNVRLEAARLDALDPEVQEATSSMMDKTDSAAGGGGEDSSPTSASDSPPSHMPSSRRIE